MRRLLRALSASAAATLLVLGFTVLPAQAAGYAAICDTGRHDATRLVFKGVDSWYLYDNWLVEGQSCQIGKTRLAMQSDGNLVIYDENNQVRWAVSRVLGYLPTTGHWAYMQNDSNFVLYPSNGGPVAGKAIWATHTSDSSDRGHLLVQSDGNVVVYDSTSSNVLWASNTRH